MSFSVVYDSIRTNTSSYLTEYDEMPHPYDLEQSLSNTASRANFGFLLGSAEVKELNQIYDYKTRSMQLVLARPYVLDGFQEVANRVESEKQILSDGYALLNYLSNQANTCSQINDLKLIGDEGINFAVNDQYITATFNLEITYKE